MTIEEIEVEAIVALVPSGVDHSFESKSDIALALVEPTGELGTSIQTLASDYVGRDLGGLVRGGWEPGGSLVSLLQGLDLPESRDPEHGTAVRATVAYVEEHLEGRPSLSEAARLTNLSASRLSHLFTAAVGIPFRRYVLWARLRRMVELVGEGDNLTRAALDAGFSDSSHLTRVFRENFGMPPSVLLRMNLSGRWSNVSSA